MQLDPAKVKYVLFDWDGTLADNRVVVITAVNQVLAEYGLGDWESIKHKHDSKLSLWDNFALIFSPEWKPAYARYVEIYKKLTPKMLKSFPDANEVLHWLKAQGIELLIMTNKDPQLLEVELPLLYNPDLFLRITPGHEAPRDKPYPDHIFYALRGLLTPSEINPSDVWMVGDSNQDSDCALAANALAIRINESLFEDKHNPSDNIIWLKDFSEFLKRLNND